VQPIKQIILLFVISSFSNIANSNMRSKMPQKLQLKNLHLLLFIARKETNCSADLPLKDPLRVYAFGWGRFPPIHALPSLPAVCASTPAVAMGR
jgi:hypothetical protein